MTIEQYDAQLEAIAAQAESREPSVLAENEEYVTVLLRRRIVEKAGYDNLAAKMNEDADFAACMEWLFTDTQMLRNYSYGGDPEANPFRSYNKLPTAATYMSSFEVLNQLYTKYKADVAETEQDAALYKRMMAAVALTHSVPIVDWHINQPHGFNNFKWVKESEPVGRYEFFKKFYLNGMLADDFTLYNTEELRMVMGTQINNEQMEWMHHYYRVRNLKNADYATGNIVKAREGNVGGAPVKYAVVDFTPNTLTGRTYFADEYYDKWNEKYTLELHDAYFDYKVDYGPNEKGQYYNAQWITTEAGGVCNHISNTGVLVRNSFGLAAIPMYQWPNHASYLIYNRNNGNPVCSSGYDYYGMASSSTKTSKVCSMPCGHTHLFNNWGNQSYSGLLNIGYVFMGIDSMYNRHNTNLEKARIITYMGDIQFHNAQYTQAETLYRKALEEQYFYLDAWIGIAESYKALGKTDEEYYALIAEAAENLKWYPTALYEYAMNLIYPRLTDKIICADILALLNETLTIAASSAANTADLLQPSYCRSYANYYLGQIPKIAGFSFNTGAITLIDSFLAAGKDLLYSFDKGETWNTWKYEEGVASHTLTPEEIAQITDANDIYYKFDTAEKLHRISIGTNTIPVSNLNVNTANDDEDKFINLQNGLEYSIDQGQTWHDLTSQNMFEGKVTVWVRKKATGVYLAGPHFVAEFTVADDTPERRYLKIKDNVTVISSPNNIGDNNKADKALDNNAGTYWQNFYSTAYMYDENKNKVPKYGDEFVFEIKDPHYISGIGYIPAIKGTYDGTISECEVYISNDKKNWKLAGSTDNWAYIKGTDETFPREQYIDFDEPAYAKYVKIKIKKAGVMYFQLQNCNVGYITAAEFKLYENVLCPDKEVAELSVTVDPQKTAYKVGDRLDLGSLTARLAYTDGTRSIIPASELTYSKDVFDSTDITEVSASYKGIQTSFAVTVAANDRTATKFSGATLADRKYYAGDEFSKDDVLLQVTDGVNNWYLLSNEFAFENATLAQGANQIVVSHNGFTGQFTVNAEKAVKEIRIDTDENFKSQYFIGDKMDLTGMHVNLVYADDTQTELAASEYDMDLTKDGDIPITEDIFARTAGTKTITVSLKDKNEISENLDVTVFSYITVGEFSFEALAGETTCKLTGFTPSEDIGDRTVEIPETINVGGYEYSVVEIANGSFGEVSGLEAVSIPKSITFIEQGAFATCTELKRIYMTDYKTLEQFSCEDGAFAEVQNGYVFLSNSLVNSPSPIKGYQVASIAQSATSITVTPPTKTEYILGDEFDKTGMVVSAVLPDGGSVNTTAYTMRGFNPAITGTQTIMITLDGTKLSQTFTVDVNFPNITIDQSPSSAAYLSASDIKPISVKATAENHYELQYQWYKSDTAEKNGTAIVGARKAQYTPTEAGYYYAAVYIRDNNNKDSAVVYSDPASISIGDYEAIIGATGYATLKAAVESAPENATILICKDIVINDVISMSGKKFTIDGQGHTIKRADDFKKVFMLLTEKTAITLKNVTFDGGAVWTGEEDPIVKRGLTNSGLTATAPFIAAYGNSQITLADGSVLQNNYNTGAVANNNNAVLDNTLTGGAIWTIDATLTLDGGVLRDNASTLFGSAVYMRGTSVLTSYKGEVTGHHAPNPSNRTTAICTDNNTTVNIQNGTFNNNKGGDAGSVLWVGHGTVIIKGGTFENNYSSGSGGVVFFSPTGNLATLTLTGGTFRNNAAKGNGGAFSCGKAATISDAVFENNTAANGGAIAIINGPAILSGNRFTNNKATNGGAVWAQNNVTTSGDHFVGNTADKGDGMYFSGSRQLGVGNVGTAQDIYFEVFKRINVTGGTINRNKYLSLVTDNEIVTGTEIANVSYSIPMDIRINGYKTEYDNENTQILKAVITPRVKYNKDGGSIDNEGSYTVYTAGTGLTLPVATKDGYRFAGWYDNAELTGSAVTEIGATETGDKEYWAKWEPADYTVTLHVNDGILSDDCTSYTFGIGAVLPVPTKDGYAFAGWYEDDAFTGSAVTEIGKTDFGDKVYWAKWAQNAYQVTLHKNGGTVETDLIAYTFGTGATLPIPTREGYTFAGWYDNADFTGAAITEIGVSETGDKAFWAKWNINEYVITFVNYDATVLQESNVQVGAMPEYRGQIPEKEQDERYVYTFDGWEPAITAVTGEATYTAKFKETPRVYSVSLNVGLEGIIENEENYTRYTYGTGITLPVPHSDDYTFEGWYDNEAFTGDPIMSVTADETGNKAFWAKWTQIAPIRDFVAYTEDGNAKIGVLEAGEYDVIFVAYDLYGRLISVEKVRVKLSGATKEMTVKPTTFHTDGAAKVKIMLWSSMDRLKPKCKTAEKFIVNR